MSMTKICLQPIALSACRADGAHSPRSTVPLDMDILNVICSRWDFIIAMFNIYVMV